MLSPTVVAELLFMAAALLLLRRPSIFPDDYNRLGVVLGGLLLSNQAVAAVGDAEFRRVDRPRLPLGFRRRRVLIQVRRGPGCVPGRCAFADGFFPPMVTGNYCGSFQSFLAMGFLRIWASGPLGAGLGRRRSSPLRMERMEARVLLVFSVFSRAFFACLVVQLPLYSVVPYLYSYVSLYVFLIS